MQWLKTGKKPAHITFVGIASFVFFQETVHDLFFLEVHSTVFIKKHSTTFFILWETAVLAGDLSPWNVAGLIAFITYCGKKRIIHLNCSLKDTQEEIL